MRNLIPLFLSILLFINFCDFIRGANIAFFFGIASYSHRITVWPLVEKLAENGHNVTFISAYPPKKPNPKVREFIPKALADWAATWDEGPLAFEDRKNGNIEWNWNSILPEFGTVVCEKFLSEPESLEWIEKTPLDLVVIDTLFNDCALALADKHKAKHMVFGTSSLFPWHYDVYGIHMESSWIPDMIYHFPQNMTFFERVFTTVNPLFWHYIRECYYMPKLDTIVKEKLGLENVRLLDTEREPSLVLLNTYFAEEFARSLPPFVIPVGGMHCKEKTEPLPKEMETFINKPGKKGFVYISFGTTVEISKSPDDIKEAFFNALKSFKDLQFIWKWEGEFPAQIPNVLFVKWAPQQDILAHPKLRGFVTHSGLLSIQEAIYHGVPLISMPVFAEQDYNAERIHRMGHGIRLEITEVTKEQLENAIHEITENPQYSAKMKILSKRFKDRPMKPVDTAVWWTEYILRHEDTSFLLPESRYQNIFQRRLLDVWAFIFAIFSIIAAAIMFTLVQLVKCLVYNHASQKTSTKSRSSKKVKSN